MKKKVIHWKVRQIPGAGGRTTFPLERRFGVPQWVDWEAIALIYAGASTTRT